MKLKVTRLDYNGYPVSSANGAASIPLDPKTFYYVVER